MKRQNQEEKNVDVPADFGVNIPYDFTKMDT
jgi:hypothetical protein